MSDLVMRAWVRLSNTLYREEGQAITEYALVLGLVAFVAGILTISGIGTKLVDTLQNEFKSVTG